MVAETEETPVKVAKVKKVKSKDETKKKKKSKSISPKSDKKAKKLKSDKKLKSSKKSKSEKKVKSEKKEKKKAKRKRESDDEETVKKSKKVAVDPDVSDDATINDESSEASSADPLLKGAKSLTVLKKEFGLSDVSMSALTKRGISSLFEIQVKTFKVIREGKDVIGRARTGMGKTLAFCLPVVEAIIEKGKRDQRGRGPAMLVLAPTRELANQVSRELEQTAPHLAVTTVYGGVPMHSQSRAMYNGLDAVVGTPGRVLDHIDRGNLKLHEVGHLILDEADQMLDMGFKEEMDKVFDFVKKQKNDRGVDERFQILLFSATLPTWVSQVASQKMSSPVTVDLVGDMASASKDVTHLCLQCPWHARGQIISDLLKVYASGNGARTIVFCQTKNECNELAVTEQMSAIAKVIHGDIAQTHRESTLQGFRTGRFSVLVATDVAARGLDIKGVDLVINAEPPTANFSGRANVDTYVHRSGRTGRAGKKGVCVTLFKHNQGHLIKAIEQETSNTLKRIGAPQSIDMLRAAADNAMEELGGIGEDVLSKFSETTATLIEKLGAERALSAALATITGFNNAASFHPRSLMSCQEGYVTVQFQHTEALYGLGYVWSALRNALPPAAVEGCRGMTLMADSMGAVFDLELKYMETLVELVESGRERKLSICTQLPDLKPKDNARQFSGGRGGRGGNRGGYGSRGRGGGFRGNGRGGGRGRSSRGRGGWRR